eukprot:SAG31_NODE_224_length_19856_cov_33.632890_16_plen_30_part_00
MYLWPFQWVEYILEQSALLDSGLQLQHGP